MTRIAFARVSRSARVACDEFALECAACPFALLASALASASDADLFYWFDCDIVREDVERENEYVLGWLLDREEEGWITW